MNTNIFIVLFYFFVIILIYGNSLYAANSSIPPLSPYISLLYGLDYNIKGENEDPDSINFGIDFGCQLATTNWRYLLEGNYRKIRYKRIESENSLTRDDINFFNYRVRKLYLRFIHRARIKRPSKNLLHFEGKFREFREFLATKRPRTAANIACFDLSRTVQYKQS